jgi:hypothetical protein
MPYAFSQIPDGYGSGRGYGRGMGGRMMAGRGFGNALYHLYKQSISLLWGVPPSQHGYPFPYL